MNFIEQLQAIASTNGQFTESVLVSRGISKNAISRALSCGLLRASSYGTVSTIPAHNRKAKLQEAVGVDLKPGVRVGVLDPETRQMMQRQVTQVQGNDVFVVDPLHPQEAPTKFPLASISIGNERDNDGKNIDPNVQRNQEPDQNKTQPGMSNPTPTV